MNRPRRRTRPLADVPAERPVGLVDLVFGGALVAMAVVGVLGLLVGVGAVVDDDDDEDQPRRRG